MDDSVKPYDPALRSALEIVTDFMIGVAVVCLLGVLAVAYFVLHRRFT